MSKSKDNKLKGLKGWLSLVTVTLVLLSLVYFLFALIQIIDIILGRIDFSVALWLVISVVFSVLFGYCLYLELKHRKEFPTWFISSLWVGSIFGIVISQIQKSVFNTSPFTFITTIIWTWYFMKSKRVRNTFVE